jgi:triosephosphate isomerase
MNNRVTFLGTNWKMNKTVSEAGEYLRALFDRLADLDWRADLQLFVIPPYTAIQTVKQQSQGKLWVGAQNMHWAEWGPYTGEISAPMLKELGVDLVELGHAERRRYFNETDESVNRKVLTALSHRIRALVCAGESLQDKHQGKEAVGRQLEVMLQGVGPEQAPNLIIAYEPVWAIGAEGGTADFEYIRSMSHHIRGLLRQRWSSEPADQVPIIYGGDVNRRNAREILNQGGVDGLFVGRAAWQAEDFAELIRRCLQANSRS